MIFVNFFFSLLSWATSSTSLDVFQCRSSFSEKQLHLFFNSNGYCSITSGMFNLLAWYRLTSGSSAQSVKLEQCFSNHQIMVTYAVHTSTGSSILLAELWAAKRSSVIIETGRATCMHRNRNPCNSLLMVKMASGMVHGRVRPTTTTNDDERCRTTWRP